MATRRVTNPLSIPLTLMRGLTLIELMVTIAIIGILAGIVWPEFNDQRRRSNRAEAIDTIMQTKSRLEQCYSKTRNFTNNTEPSCASVPTAPTTFNSPNNRYRLDVTKAPENFTIRAIAIGTQAADTDCATFQLDDVGRKTGTTNSYCWPQ